MSNTLAIAAVTATLKSLLDRVKEPVGDDPGDSALPGIDITAKPPDRARDNENSPSQLNLFLYMVTANAALRNMEFGNTGSDESALPVAIDLHYMLTAYGEGNDDVKAHLLLGRAMSILQDHAVLPKKLIHHSLSGNDLYAQIERVRVTPYPINTEEMSKLWTIFQIGYRISVGYLVSVVLIDPASPAPSPLPVLTRGPLDAGPEVYPNLTPRTPTLTQLTIPGGAPSVRSGDVLMLTGSNLGGATAIVNFQRFTRATSIPLSPDTGAPATDTLLTVTIPDSMPVGLYSVTVVAGSSGRSSNSMILSLAPSITITMPSPSPGDKTITITTTVSPAIRPDQGVQLLFDDQVVSLGVHSMTTDNVSFVVPRPSDGVHNVRLCVDGVESLLIKDYAASPPQYDSSQQVTVP